MSTSKDSERQIGRIISKYAGIVFMTGGGIDTGIGLTTFHFIPEPFLSNRPALIEGITGVLAIGLGFVIHNIQPREDMPHLPPLRRTPLR